MIKNAYIHIPFCKSKCNYCVFTSFVNSKDTDKYFNALETQITNSYKGEKLKTLYFGGGTPSLISPEKINKIINKFSYEENAEITLECNPEDKNLYDVNRISIGCQTFNDDILKIIGRRHNGVDIIKSVKNFQNAGINNISIDFIYGLPNQTIQMFSDDLKQAIDLGITHISLYGLKIEQGCYFYKFTPENLPDIDTQADMYLKANEILTQNDFKHYEISNYAKDGFESKHNLTYWNNKEYYGFGCGASGYENNIRYTNTSNIKKYLNNPDLKEYEEEISIQTKLEEEIILGFRKADGIDTKKIQEKYSVDFDDKYSKILDKYKDYFIKTPSGYALNLNGMLISNEILSEFT